MTLQRRQTRCFDIVDVEPSQKTRQESMGSKDKFWLHRPGTNDPWLFKYSRDRTGEHWAEKIAAEIAQCLHIPHAEVELARSVGEPGAISKSFVAANQELFHGNQALAGAASGQQPYDPYKRFKQSSHTFENILAALEASLPEPEIFKAKHQLASYLILDALIGNTDRHHENWGILRERSLPTLPGNQPGNWQSRLAPTFDHASSLGRELIDESPSSKCRLGRLRQKDGVAEYAERAHGAIFHRSGDTRSPSPLELVRLCNRNWPDYFRPCLQEVAVLDPMIFEEIVGAVPTEMMTDLAKTFVLAMLRYSLNELRRLNP